MNALQHCVNSFNDLKKSFQSLHNSNTTYASDSNDYYLNVDDDDDYIMDDIQIPSNHSDFEPMEFLHAFVPMNNVMHNHPYYHQSFFNMVHDKQPVNMSIPVHTINASIIAPFNDYVTMVADTGSNI